MSVNWRFWRLQINSTNDPVFVAVEFIKISATAGGATILTGGTPSASSEFSGTYDAAKAFADDSTYWATSATPTLPHWIQYDLGSGNAATGRFLEIRAYSATQYTPLEITLQGSADGSTWVDLMSVDIASYASGARWYVAAKTVRVPFGFIVSGNSTHDDASATQRVLVLDFATGALIESVVPDSGTGDYQCVLVLDTADVLVVHLGDSGYRPAADGPITPALR